MENSTLIERILDKQDNMAQDIGDIKVNLQYHIKRTDLLEESVDLHKKEFKVLMEKLGQDIEPVKKHILVINMILKGFGGLAVIISAIVGIIKIISYFS